ncbi:hypothetical protein ACHAXM_001009 [Skeletonema potamos]
MEEACTSSRVTKRRRLLSPLVATVTTVNDIPFEQWQLIADFLPKTSRLLLAIALTAPPSSFRDSGWSGQPSAVSKAIIFAKTSGASIVSILDEISSEAEVEAVTEDKLPILKKPAEPEEQGELLWQGLSNQLEAYYADDEWAILDFIDIPLSLASRLTDDDIGAILVCIDAKNNLERLKLTNCFNVVGHGLEPLRHSTVLVKLDLGLMWEFIQPYWIESAPAYDEYAFGKYAFHNTVKLSEEPVCDIVDSILRSEDSELIRLQYPYKWYAETLSNHEAPVFGNQKPDPTIVPKYHNQIIKSERMKQLVEDHHAVVNKHSCCLYFGFDDENALCSYLQQDLDDGDICLGCYDSEYETCSHCKVVMCRDCNDTFGCGDCGLRYCALCCRDNGFNDEVSHCEGDECEPYCRGCRLSGCRDGSIDCTFCKGMVYDAVLTECNANQLRIISYRDEIEKMLRVSESAVQTGNTEKNTGSIKNTDPFITIRIIEDGNKNSTAHSSVFKEDRTSKRGKVFNFYASRNGIDSCRLRFTLRGVLLHPDTTLEGLGLSGCVEICCFRAIDIVVRNQFGEKTLFKLQSESSTKMIGVINAYASMKAVDITRLRLKASDGSSIHPNDIAHLMPKEMKMKDGITITCTVQGEFLRDKYEFSQITIKSLGINHFGNGRKPSPNAAINVWCSIADFLPKSSRALLAVALTAPPASFRESGWRRKPSALSKAITSHTADGSFDSVMGGLHKEYLRQCGTTSLAQLVVKNSLRGNTQEKNFCEGLSEQLEEYYEGQWEILDFIDLPVSLAKRLTDGDIGAVLVCIDAKNKLKRLKLTHCFNVVGHGLEPLQNSTVLEKLDLGLYRQFEQPIWHKGCYTFENTKLSLQSICDLIDSILSLEGNSFLRLQYPYKLGWLARVPRFQVNKNCWEHEHKLSTKLRGLSHRHNAVINNYTSSFYFGFVNGRDFCSSLKDVWKRDIIDTCLHCLGADYGYCLCCKQVHCKNCVNKDDRFDCKVCGIGCCERCANHGFGSTVSFCAGEGCVKPYCEDCRLNSCRKGSNNCKGCKGLGFDALLEECNIKQAQINSQRDEIARLRQDLGMD